MPIKNLYHYSSKLGTSLFIGILLSGLGLAHILASNIAPELWYTLVPRARTVALNTAFCFTLAGLALGMTAALPRWQRRGHMALGALLLFLPLVIWGQYQLHLYPPEGPWRIFLNIAPDHGRLLLPNMVRSTAAGFFLTGLILFTMHAGQHARFRHQWPTVLYTLSFLLFLLGFFSAYQHFLQLLDFNQFNNLGMAFPTAIGLMLLSIGLWRALPRIAWIAAAQKRREDSQILAIAAGLLVLASLTAGLAGFHISMRQSDANMKRTLTYSLAAHARLLDSAIATGIRQGQEVASRPLMAENIWLRSQHDDASGLAQRKLQSVANSTLRIGIKSIRFIDNDGQIISSAGNWQDKTATSFRLRGATPAWFFWHNGFVMQAEIPVFHQHDRAGTLAIEVALGDLSLPEDQDTLTGSSELVVCADSRPEALCFPTRLTAHPFRLEPQTSDYILPMHLALHGEQGVKIARDYRGKDVIAAYMPIGGQGLGMVLKTDVLDWYRPMFRPMGIALALIAGLIMLSLVILTWKLTPLARNLVNGRARLRTIMDNAAEGIITIDEQGRVESFNLTAERLFAYPASAVIGQNIKMLMPSPYADEHDNYLKRYIAGGQARIIGKEPREVVGRRQDGSLFHLELAVSEMLLDGRRTFIGMIRDISQRKQIEVLLAGEKALLVMIARNAELHQIMISLTRLVETRCAGMHCAIMLLDESGRYLHCLAGPSLPDAYHQAIGPVAIGPQTGSCGTSAYRKQAVIVADIAQDPLWAGYQHIPLSHDLRACWSTPIFSSKGQVLGTFAVYHKEVHTPSSQEREIIDRATHLAAIAIEQKQAQGQVAHLAHHDALTDLPNRALLMDRLAQALIHADRSQHRVGMLFIDLDQFKRINDSLGHKIGDRLLQEVAQRLSAATRPGDTVACLGGDEFAVLLADLAHADDLTSVAQKILGALSAPIHLDSHELHITASIGASLYPDDAQDADLLLQNADTAMYRAKEEGRNTICCFAQEMNKKATRRLSLENQMRHALTQEEFLLHYQPKVDLRTGRIDGMEALVRWQHPEWGMVSPADFIPVAEETGLIVPLGEWVLHQACVQNQAWQAMGLPSLCVAVNLSMRQFAQKNLHETVARILADSKLPVHCLELELTESMLMHNADDTAKTLDNFKALGIQLSIDDFGTGYSSLSYLKRFPVDRIKIDRSFVQDATNDPDDAAIAAAIIAMAHSLGLKATAEGVETAAQLSFLRAHGCDEMQGYFFSRPLAADAFAELLLSGRDLQQTLRDKDSSSVKSLLN